MMEKAGQSVWHTEVCSAVQVCTIHVNYNYVISYLHLCPRSDSLHRIQYCNVSTSAYRVQVGVTPAAWTSAVAPPPCGVWGAARTAHQWPRQRQSACVRSSSSISIAHAVQLTAATKVTRCGCLHGNTERKMHVRHWQGPRTPASWQPGSAIEYTQAQCRCTSHMHPHAPVFIRQAAPQHHVAHGAMRALHEAAAPLLHTHARHLHPV